MLTNFISEKPWLLAIVLAILGAIAIPAVFPLITPQEETVQTSVGGTCVEEVWVMPFFYRADGIKHHATIEDLRAEGKEPLHTMTCRLQVRQ